METSMATLEVVVVVDTEEAVDMAVVLEEIA